MNTTGTFNGTPKAGNPQNKQEYIYIQGSLSSYDIPTILLSPLIFLLFSYSIPTILLGFPVVGPIFTVL